MNKPQKSTIANGEHIEDSQIVQVVEAYLGRWMHHIVIEKPSSLHHALNVAQHPRRGLCQAAFFFSKLLFLV